ncbi:aldehyde dehydrogenase [Salipaludibacillus sp. CF4.18]|uniref:aldehyde dehydrogenase n=1 Tax=Salipaludibacillus sp. CF4.18 TaxID=3373081 RepID=UPI003EE5B6C5
MNVHPLYINGEYTKSSTNEVIDIINPSTEEVISRIYDGTVEDVDQAVMAADRAQKSWGLTPSIERGKIVRLLGEKLAKKKDLFVNLLIEEQGKSFQDANGELDLAIDYFQYMSEWARRIEGEILPSDRSNENLFIFKKPIGVVGGIIPWNFPVFILARKVATALIAGCTIVIKPSQQTPNTAAEFTKLIDETDLPKGVYNFITGKGSTLGNALASHKKVSMITMTGSVPAGVKVMEAAAQNITKVNLELGGKAPAIVSKYANLDVAVESIKQSRLTNSGQACTNAERVYVHEDVAEEFTKKMVSALKKATYGNPQENKKADIGPLISKEHMESVYQMVLRAKEDGGNIEVGGKPANVEKGFFFEPTVITNVNQEMEIIQEEIFGPVLPIMTYKEFDDAIDMANDSDYGLSSSIYTDNIHEAMRAANELSFDETFVNRENFEAVQGYHAGVRQSGLGGADGKHGLHDFLVTHTVYMEYNSNK